MPDVLARAIDRAGQTVRAWTRAGFSGGSASPAAPVRDLGLYARRLEGDPESLYGGLSKPSDLGAASLGRRGTVEVLQVSFSSPCQPVHPEYVARFEAEPQNHLCYARWLRRDARPRAAWIVLHDWAERSLGAAVRRLGLEALARTGADVIVPMLPHHGPRAGPRSRFSGERMLCADLACTVEAHLQAVREARALVGWLRARGVDSIGIAGIGIGGLVAALVCSRERDLVGAALLLAPSSLENLLLARPPLLRGVREGVRAQGALGVVPEAWRPLDATHVAPAIPSARIRVIGATGDGFVPTAEVERLARAMATPVGWVAGGHGGLGSPLRGGRLLLHVVQRLGQRSGVEAAR